MLGQVLNARNYAGAVVRDQQIEFQIQSPTRALYRVKEVITVLDKKAEKMLDLSISHDSFHRLRRVSGTLHDENGRKIRDLKKSEFDERSGYPGFVLFAETRVTSTDLYSSRFLVTVEYAYEIEYRDAFFPPWWCPVQGTGVTVQSASYTVIPGGGISIRKMAFNTDLPDYVEHNLNDDNANKWYIKNYRAVKRETYMPPIHHWIPYAFVAFNDFNYGGYRGNMSSWKNFGLWISELNKGRQTLPNETIKMVREIVKDIDDPLEKAPIIYEYVQGKTRYVAIILGIGGFQPAETTQVDRVGYGECKALSNYTISLLKAVGVEAFYTLIWSGFGIQTKLEFPSDQLNHIIVCVPHQGDTLWLETTTIRFSAGHVGPGNSNRYVLLVKPEGGEMVKTPAFNRTNSFIKREIVASLDAKGALTVKLETKSTGSNYDDAIEVFLNGPHARRSTTFNIWE